MTLNDDGQYASAHDKFHILNALFICVFPFCFTEQCSMLSDKLNRHICRLPKHKRQWHIFVQL